MTDNEAGQDERGSTNLEEVPISDGVRAASEAWPAITTALAQGMGGRVQRNRGVSSVYTPLDLATVNGVQAVALETEPGALLAAIDAYVPLGPWAILSRTPLGAAEIDAAERRGLTSYFTIPLMTRAVRARDTDVVPADEGVTVRGLSRTGDPDVASLMAAGFGFSPQNADLMSSAGVLGQPEVDGVVVATADGPVAMAVTVTIGSVVTVINVTTLPAARRRGYAELATRSVMARAAGRGASMLFLHPTTEGAPLYERLGFTFAEQWHEVVAPSS